MARKLIYEVVLDSEAYTRQIRKVEAQTTAFAGSLKKTGKETEHLARGAAYGSGAFTSLGRSLAFASGGFLAFQSGTAFLRASVDAATQAAVAQRSLAAQMKASGESFVGNKDRVEEVARSYGKLGFANDAVIQSLTVLDRATGNINKAISLQGVTADVARVKNIDLAAAAAVVGKVFGGQETALRRAVPGLSKTAHGMDLIREAEQKLAGQAAAATTAQEKFSANLTNTEEIIGSALLPTLNIYLDKLSNWMSNTKNQATLQADAAAAAQVMAAAVTALGDAYTVAAAAVGAYKKAVDLLAPSSSDSWWQHAIKTVLVPGYGIREVAQAIRRHAGGSGGTPPGLAGPSGTPGTADGGGGLLPGLAGPTDGSGAAPKGATVAQRNSWFDAMVGRRELRAGLLTSASAQLAAFKAIGRILTARIAATHDITRKLSLEDQGLQNAATVAGLQVQIAADLKQKQLDAAQKIKDQIDAARTEKQGWLDFAIERAQATATIKDDLAAYRAKEQFLKGLIKTEGRTLDLVSELWRTRQQIKDLNKKNAGSGDPLAGLFQVSSKQLTNILAAGTGLGAAGRRQLGFNIAGAELQPLHVHLNVDGREVAAVVAKHQARDATRTPRQTSGRRG